MWNLKPEITESALREYAEKEIGRSFTLLNLQHYLVNTDIDFDKESRKLQVNVDFEGEMAIESFSVSRIAPEDWERESMDELLIDANLTTGDVLTKFGKLPNVVWK